MIGPFATIFLSRLQLRYRIEVFWKISGAGTHECPICRYVGKFKAFGNPPRYNAQCPSCHSLERHRLFYLALQRLNLLSGSEYVLHFAPEACLGTTIQKASANYRSADYAPGCASMQLNIEEVDLPDKSVDVVIANHVLEHVDDRAALREIWRILADHGRLILMVPIIEGWKWTYEDPRITGKAERHRHFGQDDHVRYFGLDFRTRVLSEGFSLDEFVCDGADTVRYALTRGESVFICTKSSVL
jgi:SAM-dependent methyltransferase